MSAEMQANCLPVDLRGDRRTIKLVKVRIIICIFYALKSQNITHIPGAKTEVIPFTSVWKWSWDEEVVHTGAHYFFKSESLLLGVNLLKVTMLKTYSLLNQIKKYPFFRLWRNLLHMDAKCFKLRSCCMEEHWERQAHIFCRHIFCKWNTKGVSKEKWLVTKKKPT